MLGEVTEVFLNAGNDTYKIEVSKRDGFGTSIKVIAYPLNPYVKSIPIVGEHVYLISTMIS